MCQECGCGAPEHHHEHSHEHQHEHGHSHAHPHPHEHGHEHTHTHPGQPRTVSVREAILDKNDRQAERNRGFFRARGMLVLNVVSSPGSGKTTLVQQTIRALGNRLKAGVIVGDLATDNDAARLRQTGAPVVQINTGTVCHLDAEMVARSIKDLNQLAGLDLLIIENVGNLVCPASFDLGEDLRVVLFSVTEGEDKPLKYPPMFNSADVVVISKIDLAEACDHDSKAAMASVRKCAPDAVIFQVSSKKGDGLNAWVDFLVERHKELKNTGIA